jgi:hypothetical protein
MANSRTADSYFGGDFGNTLPFALKLSPNGVSLPSAPSGLWWH